MHVAPTRRRCIRAFILLATLVGVAYGGALRNGYVFDDAIFVERDERLASFAGVKRLFTEPLWGFTDKASRDPVSGQKPRGLHQYYRPLQLIAPAASKIVLGGAAWPVHLSSLVLHLACVMMLYEVLLSLSRLARAPNAPPVDHVAALVLAATFSIHPANSEAVLWASDLSGLGATACLLAIVLLHAGAHRLWSPLLVTALALSAMLFKESGVLAPALLALYDFFIGKHSSPRRGIVFDYLGVTIALALYLALRVHALGGLLPGADTLELGPFELVLNALALLPSYVRAFVWPFELNMYHDFAVARTMRDPRVIAGTLLALAVGLAIVAGWRRSRLTGSARAAVLSFGLAWIALTISPWLLVRWPQLNAFAERYLYLPSIGLYIAVLPMLTAALARLQARAAAVPAPADSMELAPSRQAPRASALRTGVVLGAAIVGSAFLVRDVSRTREWRDELTIYEKTLTQSPRAELIRNNLALRYLELGEPERGIPIQEELLRIDADFPSGWHNLGLLQLRAGRTDEARAAFEKSAQLEPNNPATALNLGYVYELSGQREKAIERYVLATILDAGDSKPWYNLAVIAVEEGQYVNARKAIAEVLTRSPDDRAAQRLREKVAQAGPSVRRAPEPTANRCREARQAAEDGRPREAIVKLEAAAWLDESSALPHHFLANLRYLGGRPREAYRHEREALLREPNNALYRANTAALEKVLGGATNTDVAPRFEAQQTE